MERYSGNNVMIGTNNNMGYGYTAYNNTNVDYNVLLKLGFSGEEIDFVNQVAAQFGKVTSDRVNKLTGNPILAKKLSYLYNIIRGADVTRVIECVNTIRQNSMVCSSDDIEVASALNNLSSHYRKLHQQLNGKARVVFNKTLPRPKLGVVPKKAIVGGIKDEIFCIYNSNRYLVKDRLYDVVSYNDTNTLIRTTRTPVLANGVQPKVPGIGEIKEDTKPIRSKNGEPAKKTVLVSLNNKYVRLCNRYIVAASTQKPTFHCGMIEMICRDGTLLYVYAVELLGGDKVNGGIDKFTGEASQYKENSSTRVVYDYGYRACDLEQKVEAVAGYLYKGFQGIIHIKVKPQHVFAEGVLKKEVVQEEQHSEIESKY